MSLITLSQTLKDLTPDPSVYASKLMRTRILRDNFDKERFLYQNMFVIYSGCNLLKREINKQRRTTLFNQYCELYCIMYTYIKYL